MRSFACLVSAYHHARCQTDCQHRFANDEEFLKKTFCSDLLQSEIYRRGLDGDFIFTRQAAIAQITNFKYFTKVANGI